MKRDNLKDRFSFRKNKQGMIIIVASIIIGLVFIIMGSVFINMESNDSYSGNGERIVIYNLGNQYDLRVGTSTSTNNMNAVTFTPSSSGYYEFEVTVQESFFNSHYTVYGTLKQNTLPLMNKQTSSNGFVIEAELRANVTYHLFLNGTDDGYCYITVNKI